MALSLYGIDLSGGASASSTQPVSAVTPVKTDSANSQTPESDVSITSTASLLARLQQSFGTQSPVDSARVNAISKSLAAGTYTVQPDKIATGLIHVERALGK